jgi:hypothetical protein
LTLALVNVFGVKEKVFKKELKLSDMQESANMAKQNFGKYFNNFNGLEILVTVHVYEYKD